MALGYHTNGFLALTYSRDGASQPLAILCSVLREVRHGVYKPDETRSGRLVSELNVNGESNISNQRVIDVTMPEHITTDSSSDTEPETVEKPAGYARPFLCPEGTTGWRHRKFVTVHLSFQGHVRALLCGRCVTHMHERVSSPLPFDSPCRQCFNSKLLTDRS